MRSGACIPILYEGGGFIMAVAKMKLVNIVGRLRDFDNVVQQCCIKGNFHPEQSSLALDNVEEFVPIEEPNPYARTLQKLVDLGVQSGVRLQYSNFDRNTMTDRELTAYVEKTGKELDALGNKVRELNQTTARLEQGLAQLSHLTNLGISLDDLFGSKFIRYRFGRLPKDSFPKLDFYEDSDYIFFFPLEEDSGYYWGFYVSPVHEIEKADEVFNSLYFERIDILEEAHGTPAEATVKIGAQLEQSRRDLEAAKARVQEYIRKNRDPFLVVYSKVRYLHDSFEIHKYASKCGDNFYIFGWVPEREIPAFTKQFDRLPDVDCVVENTEEAENIDPPTSLVNNASFRPFESFVEMYGLPAYNEVDPTPLLAITYTIFFGIMFGDLGQGFVILALGAFLWFHKRRRSSFGGILMRLGISSMTFGALYNTIFGYEGKLPFTILPVHENAYVNTVLFSTVGLGVFILLISMVVNLVNAVRQKNIEKLVFSQNGLAGMVFYASIVLAFVLILLYQKNILSPVFIVCLLVVPLLLIFLKEPLAKLCEHKPDWKPENTGEFIISSFFEVFEVVLSFATNTISFIRIGAYILSHAGMMLAVFALSSMSGHTSIVGVVIGNILVIGLEGMLSGIQVIRLEFYEMFSHFFDGTGKPYTPAKINY
jgi:V/A-type H+-transporting ATPase subunit I